MLRRGSGAPAALALVGSCTLLAALILISRFSVHAATLRATIETALILFGLLSAWFIWVRSSCTRHVSDFLLLGAVLTLTLAQLAFSGGPAMLGSDSPDYGATVPLIAHLEIAFMFAAAALVRRRLVANRREAAFLVAAPVVGAAAVAVGALLISGDAAWFGPDEHRQSTTSALAVALTLPSVLFLLVAAVGFAGSAKPRKMMMGLLGAAAALLAGAWSQWLPVSDLTANSVSGRECLCAGAFSLILLFAFNSHRQLRHAQADELTSAERRRLVRDLHDGMAQDLAFIATYAERLARDFGPDHPLTVAARRALAASRGVIADVSASDEPNAVAALRAVADELSVRHGVRVTVEADAEDISASKREAVVRIAREAIVNAVQHGKARHIAVSLETRGDQLTLRVIDDGRGLRNGISAQPARGFGLRAMRERAEAGGGHLIVGERSDGGTSVEAVVS